jgi:hypothetical protein
MKTGYRHCVRVSAELVEDLNLARFCSRGDFGRGDTYWIDRRRKKRELRRLPAQKTAALAAFKAQVVDSRYRNETIKMAQIIVLDDVLDEPLTEEQKQRVLAWWDANLTKSFRQTAMHGDDDTTSR